MTLPALPVTWSLDGVQLNVGADALSHSAIVDVPEWDNAPAPKPRFTERTEGHGAYFAPNYRAGKAMRIKGVAQAPSPESREVLRDRLAGLCLNEDTLYPLTCDNPIRGDQLTMWVSIYDEPVIRKQTDGVSLFIDIPVFAPTPWKFSAPNDPVSTGQASAGIDGILWNGSPGASGGIEWNGSPSVSGGLIYEDGAGSTGTLRLFNSGNREAPVTLTITATSVNPLLVGIRPDQTQNRLKWLGTVAGNNYLEINTDTQRVSLGNSNENRVNVNGTLAESGFFTVPPNSYLDIVYSHDAVSNSQVTAVSSNVYA